jgi:N-acetylglucosaminyldiphosphoundecaprenol N-acetyl-beta-D-mannosaminyltransferase
VTGPARRGVLGLEIDALTTAQAVDRCTAAVVHGEYLPVGMVNTAKVVSMWRNERLRRALTGCRMVLPDGRPLVWASRLLRSPLPERVTGIDLFFRLLAQAARRSYRVYFLGAEANVLVCVLAEVRCSYPGLVVAGARDGSFGPEEGACVAAEIREAGADLLFLGMTSPRNEFFISEWGQHAGVKVAHGVAGSFDVLAGLTRRAPGAS